MSVLENVDPRRSTLEGTIESIAGVDGLTFDWMMTVGAFVTLIGAFWDWKSHIGGISIAEEGVFTGAHITLYVGLAIMVLAMGSVIVANRLQGDSWFEAIPLGYRWGAFGIILLLVATPTDALWHLQFGFEEGTEAVISPTHMIADAGILFTFASPFRAAMLREEKPTGIVQQIPMAVGAGLVLMIMVTFTHYANPFMYPAAAIDGAEIGRFAPRIWGIAEVTQGGDPGLGVTQLLGSAAIFVFTVVLTAHASFIVRLFRPAFGVFSIIYTMLGAYVWWGSGILVFLPIMVLVGIFADLLVAVLKPSLRRKRAFQAFLTLVPLSWGALYFTAIHLLWGTSWTFHMWSGWIVGTGVLGLAVSYVVLPYAEYTDHLEQVNSDTDM